jgi:uncharacterized SAM-binding protein YcdF (DUF218 family)
MVESLKILISIPGLILLLLIVGAILASTANAHKRAGRIMIGLALFLFVALGNGPVAYRLIETLEKQHPLFSAADPAAGPSWIVVLTSVCRMDDSRPASSMAGPSSLYRIAEAAALFKLISESEIVVSGDRQCAEAMRAVLAAVGVPEAKIITEGGSANTWESAVNVRKLAGERQKMILVTSANHMPRAVASFKKAGLDPIPAPTDYQARNNYGFLGYLPTLRHLECANLFIYESLGMAWYKPNGWA